MTRKKARDTRAVTMYAPIGGVLTKDHGIAKGELVWSLEPCAVTSGTNVFVRYRGDEERMLLQGSPLKGAVTVEQIREAFRSMTVRKDDSGAILPFSF